MSLSLFLLIASLRAILLLANKEATEDLFLLQAKFQLGEKTEGGVTEDEEHFQGHSQPSARAALVVSRVNMDDVDWLKPLAGLPRVLYTEDIASSSFARIDPFTKPKPLTQEGASTRECGGYLAYIVENYERLPEAVAFLQGQPLRARSLDWENKDWHTDLHFEQSVLNIAKSPERIGYCSLNAVYADWTVKEKGEESPWYVQTWKQELRDAVAKQPGKYDLLNHTMNEMLPKPGVQCFCCAQFAVGRQRILRLPQAFYKQLLDFVMDSSPSTWQGPRTNVRCSLLERTWHLIFGEAASCDIQQASCRAVFEGTAPLRHIAG